jgi:hypothetical protein
MSVMGSVTRFRACTPFLPVHNGATAATKLPRADGEAVPPCSYRVLAAASVMGRLLPQTSQKPINAKFAEFPFYALR